MRLWRRDGRLLNTLTGHSGGVYDVRFNPEGSLIATASQDKTAKLWTLNGELLQTLTGHNGIVYSVSFSPDNQTIATASHDQTIKLWNFQGDVRRTLKGSNEVVQDVSFSPDGQLLASAGNANTVVLWNLEYVDTLENLIRRGCNWVHDYLTVNPTVAKSDELCIAPNVSSTLRLSSVASNSYGQHGAHRSSAYPSARW